MEEIWRARHKKILENTEVDPLSSITQINQRFCEFDSNKKLKIEKQLQRKQGVMQEALLQAHN